MWLKTRRQLSEKYKENKRLYWMQVKDVLEKVSNVKSEGSGSKLRINDK